MAHRSGVVEHQRKSRRRAAENSEFFMLVVHVELLRSVARIRDCAVHGNAPGHGERRCCGAQQVDITIARTREPDGVCPRPRLGHPSARLRVAGASPLAVITTVFFRSTQDRRESGLPCHRAGRAPGDLRHRPGPGCITHIWTTQMVWNAPSWPRHVKCGSGGMTNRNRASSVRWGISRHGTWRKRITSTPSPSRWRRSTGKASTAGGPCRSRRTRRIEIENDNPTSRVLDPDHPRQAEAGDDVLLLRRLREVRTPGPMIRTRHSVTSMCSSGE